MGSNLFGIREMANVYNQNNKALAHTSLYGIRAMSSIYSPNIPAYRPPWGTPATTPGQFKPPAPRNVRYNVSVAGTWPQPARHGAPSKSPWTAQNYALGLPSLTSNVGLLAIVAGSLGLLFLLTKRL